MSILEKPEIKDWLEELRKSSTIGTYSSRMKYFFEWYQGSYEEFLKLDAKALRHVLLKFQNEQLEAKVNPNTVNGVITTLSSFLMFLEKPVNLRGKRNHGRPDIDSHIFSNGDLTKMFTVASTKEKCILALGASLGWEVSAVIELDRKTLQSMIDRAKAEKTQFVYFSSIRKKTGVPRLGVLNPLALEWSEKWLSELAKIEGDRINRNKNAQRKRKQNRLWDRPISNVFDIAPDAVNKMLRRLVRHAGIVTTGRVHFHKIRGWVMSGLSRCGFNEFQIKYVIGKAIPISDMTYLQTLQQEIEERYPKAYDTFLNINPPVLKETVKPERVQSLEEQIKQLIEDNKKLNEKVEQQLEDIREIKLRAYQFTETVKKET